MTEAMRTRIEALVEKAFKGTREPRSAEYKHGVFAGIAVHLADANAREMCLCYPMGSASRDAFYAGLEEGHGIAKTTPAKLARGVKKDQPFDKKT